MSLAQSPAPQIYDNNWKNCIIRQGDANFFVGGKFKWNTAPFANNTKISVVNNNLTDNYSLTNANFNNQAWDEVFAVDEYTSMSDPRGTPTKRYVGGDFVYYNGTLVNGFMRILGDGSLDTNFTLNNGSPFNSVVVRTMAQQNDYKVIVAGNFTKYFNITRNYIARLNENGTLDTSFNQTGTGFNGQIYSIKIQSDGKVVVGGDFTSYNGVARSRIARLNADGSLDMSFNINLPVDKVVRTVLIQPDGKILVGGDFTITGYPCPDCLKILYNRLVRLNANGTIDSSFLVLTGFVKTSLFDGSNIASVRTLSLNGTKVFVGGEFDTYQGVSRKNICQLTNVAGLDADFNSSVHYPDAGVYGSLIESGNAVIVGAFFKYDNITKNGIARIAPTGLAMRMTNESASISENESQEFNKYHQTLSSDVVLSPNPAENWINISTESGLISRVTLTSLDGKKIVEQDLPAQTSTYNLNIEKLPKGVFIVSIVTSEAKILLKKLVKN